MISELYSVLSQGGPILWALIILGVGLYTMLSATWFNLLQIKKEIDTAVIIDPEHTSSREIMGHTATFKLDRLAWVERRLPFIGVLAGSAPLAGLLGTVSGMLVTFSGLASSSTAKPIDKIAVGISEALITTQAGLLIAIPAAFLLALLRKQTAVTHSNIEQMLHRALIKAH